MSKRDISKELDELRYEQERTACLLDLHKGSHEPDLLMADMINRNAFEKRAKLIRQLEKEVNSELYSMRFSGGGITEGAMPLDALAELLPRLQRVAVSIVHDCKEVFKKAHKLKKFSKENEPRLSVLAFQPGSFILHLAGAHPDNDMFNGDPSVRKSDIIYASSTILFQTITSGDDKDKLYHMLGQMSETTAGTIRSFYDVLGKNEISLTADWVSNDKMAPVSLTPATAAAASELIRRYPWQNEPTRVLTGHIKGYNQKGRTIAFTSLEGKAGTYSYLQDMQPMLAALHITMYGDDTYTITLAKKAISKGKKKGRPAWFLTDITKET